MVGKTIINLKEEPSQDIMRNKTTVNPLVAVSTYFYGFYTIVYRENENWFML